MKLKVINFTIESQGTNPIPYKRMTQGEVKMMRIPRHRVRPSHLAKWDGMKRYFDWKDYVELLAYKYKFNRSPKKKVFLNVMIYFKNKAHADPENVRKGIQDAIFTQDKYVAGSVDFDYDNNRPRCEVEIIENNKIVE